MGFTKTNGKIRARYAKLRFNLYHANQLSFKSNPLALPTKVYQVHPWLKQIKHTYDYSSTNENDKWQPQQRWVKTPMFFWRSTYSLHRTSMRFSSISPFFFHVNPPVVFRCMTNCCYLLSSQAAGNHLEAPTSPGWPPLSPAGSFQADYRVFQCPNQICEVPTASNYVCICICTCTCTCTYTYTCTCTTCTCTCTCNVYVYVYVYVYV